MEQQNKTPIEQKVMSQIKSGRLKLRSKYLFLAEKLGLGSAFVLSLILAVLLFNLALFYLKATGNLQYLSFGRLGIYAFLESFPYLLVVGLIIFLLIAGWLIKASDVSYKKPFGYLVIAMVAFVMLAGSVLAFTELPETIGRQAFESRGVGRMFKPFLNPVIREKDWGMVGKVFTVSDGSVIIQTPSGLKEIDLSDLSHRPEMDIVPGQFIISTGRKDKDDEIFKVERFKLIEGEAPPLIKQGIMLRFSSSSSSLIIPPPEEFPPIHE